MRFGQYEPPVLTKYIDNRDQILKDIRTHYGDTRKQAKTLTITLIFDGFQQTWVDECHIKISKDVRTMGFISDIQKELKSISTNTELTSKFPLYDDLFTVVCVDISEKKKRNPAYPKDPLRTTMAVYLQNVEQLSISTMKDKLEKIGITVSSKIHDELLIDMKENAIHHVHERQDKIIDMLVTAVKEKFDFDIQLEAEVKSPSENDLAIYNKYLQFVTQSKKDDIVENKEYAKSVEI